jgi:hypothetical protein
MLISAQLDEESRSLRRLSNYIPGNLRAPVLQLRTAPHRNDNDLNKARSFLARNLTLVKAAAGTAVWPLRSKGVLLALVTAHYRHDRFGLRSFTTQSLKYKLIRL